MVAKWAGRKGRPWERTRRAILARSNTCHLCGHEGAGEVDHIIPRSLGGNPVDPGNLAPAHGWKSPCPICGKRCNQVKKNRVGLRAQAAPVRAEYARW